MDISAERRYAEEAGVVLAGMGMPQAYGKLLGWLLICTPAAQSGAELVAALGLSKGSVSAGLRQLETSGLVRRVAMPGRRGSFYEMTPDAIMRAAGSEKFTYFRQLMDRGLEVVGGEDAPGAERLRTNRDFYAFLEVEVPKLIQRFKDEKRGRSDG
ncbi:MarR family transcriptional regulator [Actinoplanes sp. NPDC048791]|uniref:GbsR/MarR family transcriptional regulator n=1 Tax=Actinoplanes sp. NPDC048791 TaxID=3154623 RepID=UPI0033F50130